MGNTDSKTAIRAAVLNMCSNPVDEERPVWEQLWVGSTTEDVFEAVSIEDVRNMIRHHPRNLVLFVRRIVAILQAVAESPDPVNYPVTLTAVRLLTRIMPVIQEDPASGFCRKVMWENRVPPPREAIDPASLNPPPPAAPAGEDSPPPAPPAPELDEVHSSEAIQPAPLDDDEVPLGRLLVDAVYQLCFLPDFTVPKDQYTLWASARAQSDAAEAAAAADTDAAADGDDAGEAKTAPRRGSMGGAAPSEMPSTAVVETLLLWNAGVGFPDIPVSSTASLNRNRVEILRLVLVLMSGPLFYVPDAASPVVDPFCSEFVSPRCTLLPTLFYSLLNSVLAYDPVGWGVPYGSSMVSDTQEPLMNMALQVLLVCLDYSPNRVITTDNTDTYGHTAANRARDTAGAEDGADGDAEGDADGDTEAAPRPQSELVPVPNLYRGLIAGLHTEADFRILLAGIIRLLNHVHRADNTYLPYSMKQLDNHQEVLVLLWKAMDTNPDFLSFLLTQDTAITQVVVPILYYMFQARNKAARVGLVHICTFTLLLLSGSRAFGVALNEPFVEQLPAHLPLFRGNHADLLVIVLHKLIVAGNDGLKPLFNCFLTVICNVSSYIKKLSMVASVKLVNLFQLFGSPKFLFRQPNNHVFVEQLLTTFNNIIQYQYEGNTHLVYSILRRKDAFYLLAGLRVQQPPQQQQAAVNGGARSPPPPPAQAPAAAAPATPAAAATTPADGDSPATDAEAGAGPTSPDASPTNGSAADGARAEAAPPVAGAGAGAGAGTGAGAGAGAEGAAGAAEPTTDVLGGPGTAAAAAGPWRPSQEWLASWHPKLMLEPVLRLINYLAPRMERFCSSHGAAVDDGAVLEFLQKATVVGVLPVPHPIMMKRYQANEYTHLWFTTFLWGNIFLRNQDFVLLDSRTIQLFSIAYVAK